MPFANKKLHFLCAQSNMYLESTTVDASPVYPSTARFLLPKLVLTSFGIKLDVRGGPTVSIPVRRVQHGVVRVLLDRASNPPEWNPHTTPFLARGRARRQNAAVLSYPSGEFAVIVSEYDHPAGELNQQAAIDHARVVSNCFRNSTVLPFKFGTIFDSDDALRQAVRVNRRAFGQSVARLRGKSEMHIKLVVRDGSLREAMIDIQLPDTVGGDYLSKLRVKASRERERQTKARALSVQVHKLFNPLEEEVSCKKVAPEGMLIDIAHLIDSKSVEKYQNRYSTAANS